MRSPRIAPEIAFADGGEEYMLLRRAGGTGRMTVESGNVAGRVGSGNVAGRVAG